MRQIQRTTLGHGVHRHGHRRSAASALDGQELQRRTVTDTVRCAQYHAGAGDPHITGRVIVVKNLAIAVDACLAVIVGQIPEHHHVAHRIDIDRTRSLAEEADIHRLVGGHRVGVQDLTRLFLDELGVVGLLAIPGAGRPLVDELRIGPLAGVDLALVVLITGLAAGIEVGQRILQAPRRYLGFAPVQGIRVGGKGVDSRPGAGGGLSITPLGAVLDHAEAVAHITVRRIGVGLARIGEVVAILGHQGIGTGALVLVGDP